MADECWTPGCKVGGHRSYGDCIRSKHVAVVGANMEAGHDRSWQKRWDAELDLYESTVKQGIEPESTRTADIRAALDYSDRTGTAYIAG